MLSATIPRQPCAKASGEAEITRAASPLPLPSSLPLRGGRAAGLCRSESHALLVIHRTANFNARKHDSFGIIQLSVFALYMHKEFFYDYKVMPRY